MTVSCTRTLLTMALVASGSCMAQGALAQGKCAVLAGTADGFDKETAVSRAQLGLDEYVRQYKEENHLGAVTRKGHARRTAALLARQGQRKYDVPPRHHN